MKTLSAFIQESKGNINRLLTQHAKTGYIIISACRTSNSVAQNKKATADLEKTIKDAGWSYSPCTGHYVEEISGKPAKEASFAVYCNKKGTPADFSELKDFAIEQCKVWNQDSVLVAEPNKTPAYFDKAGKKVEERWAQFTDTPAIQREDEPYQTQLGSSKFAFKTKD